MRADHPKHIINQLRGKLINRRVAAIAIMAAGYALLVAVILNLSWHLNYWIAVPVFSLFLAIYLWIAKPWKVTAMDISRFLNSQYPQLEESSQLALQPYGELGLLEQMQLEKTAVVLQQIPLPKLFNKSVFKSLFVLIASVLMCCILLLIARDSKKSMTSLKPAPASKNSKIIPEKKPTGVANVEIMITPPAYTHKTGRKQQEFSIVAEEDAIIRWNITTTGPTARLSLLINDHTSLPFKKGVDNLSWNVTYKLSKPGFYQLMIDSVRSELFKLELIPDQPPGIRIIAPKQYTTIEAGHKRQVSLQAVISDDYGIRNVVINATKASGKGEGVRFKDLQLPFATRIANQRQLELNKMLDLNALAMRPGDELYFFIKAVDSRGTESRSDMYFISLADTAELMSMSGLTSGVNLVPEYFRSQRQIIIDTEKLLAEKKEISDETFKNRSNNLGIDQKLLRLRYGKFLGEENETNIGAPHDDDDDHEGSHEQANSTVESIMDQYAHKHDIAEDATFFNPDQKKQLKATLTEMWSAELQLRSFKPQDALPYEYKALRLLKDLQQKSRAYVAKTALKMPPLKEEKRLTGNLEKIINPVVKRNSKEAEDRKWLQTATSIVASLREGIKLKDADKKYLYEAEKIIADHAATNPYRYLIALAGIRRLLETNAAYQSNDIAAVEAALQQLITNRGKTPLQPLHGAAPALSDLYFDKLKNRQSQ